MSLYPQAWYGVWYKESPITFVKCKRWMYECECSHEHFSLQASAGNQQTLQDQIPNNGKAVSSLPILFLLGLLPGTRSYILSGMGHSPSAPACWAKGSNGQREHCLVRRPGRTCFSLAGNSFCLSPLEGEDGVRREGTESRRRAAKGPEGPAALAGSQPHPDVVGGEWDGAESPCLAADTGWVPFAGILQIAQNRGSTKGAEQDFLLYLGRGGGFSFWKRNS